MENASFSGKVKEELAAVTGQALHCCRAELAALVCFLGREGSLGEVLWQTENESVSRKCFTLIEKTFNIRDEVFLSDVCHAKHAGHAGHTGKEGICLASAKDKEGFLKKLGLAPSPEPEGSFLAQDPGLFRFRCCVRAFIRGAFLAAGSVSDPSKGYHFEIVCPDLERAALLQELMKGFEVAAGIVPRRRSYVLYVKDGSQLADLLAVMGASLAVMDLENIRILREMRNTVNRKVNCETANINKTVSASYKQVEDIRLIERAIGLDHLSESLRRMAELRLAYPHATLKELGQMSEPALGKSGVNHRLRRLSSLADDLRQNEETDALWESESGMAAKSASDRIALHHYKRY